MAMPKSNTDMIKPLHNLFSVFTLIYNVRCTTFVDFSVGDQVNTDEAMC